MARDIRICKYCGNEFEGERNQRYCCRDCANKGRVEDMEDFDHTLEWGRTADKRWRCPYRSYVSCHRRKCTSCGWHPEVEKERTKEILRKMAEEE